MTDIVERLRAVGGDNLTALWSEAADLIERQRAEIERLHEKANMIARADFSNLERIAELEEEIARLKTALLGIVTAYDGEQDDYDLTQIMISIARAVLEGKP